MLNKEQIINAPSLYVNGLEVGWLSGTQVRIFGGIARDFHNQFDIEVPASIDVDISVKGVNGLDTGAIAPSTAYALYVIADSSRNKSTAALISANLLNAPYLPAGYDIVFKLMQLKSDLVPQIAHFQVEGNSKERILKWDLPVNVLTAGAALSWTPITLASATPIGIPSGKVLFQVDYTPSAVTDTVELKPYGSPAGSHVKLLGPARFIAQAELFANEVSSALHVDYKVTAGTVTIDVLGYTYYI